MPGPLTTNRNTNEKHKFKSDSGGDTAVNTCVDTGVTGEPLPSSQKKENPKITNVPAPTSGTEYSYTFTDGTKSFRLKARKNSTIQYAWDATESSTDYITIGLGGFLDLEGLWLNSKTIYFQSNVANNTIEIEEWT